MITQFSVSSLEVAVTKSDSRYYAFEFPIDRTEMESDGWEEYEYTISFSKDVSLVGAHPNSYSKVFTSVVIDEYGGEATTDTTVWINFIPII